MAEPLFQVERAAADEPEGLLVLHHGRGTDEGDLIRLADFLDPEQRLRVVSPRAPLQLPGSPGYHWYLVPRVGFPDPETFEAARLALAELHDRLWEETGVGPGRTVLGGFSPTVEGWEPALADRTETRAFVSHGRNDPVIGIDFAERARELLAEGGLDVTYRESDLGHQIDPAHLSEASAWLGEVLR